MRFVCPLSPDAECVQSFPSMPTRYTAAKGPKKRSADRRLYLPFDRVAVSGVWENEDQKLARPRLGFRALTRTPVVSKKPL